MLVLQGKSESLSFLRQSHLWDFEEVYVWREGSEEVEDVVPPVVANDAFALDAAAQFHLLTLVVHDLNERRIKIREYEMDVNSIFYLVREYFKLISGFLKKIEILGLSDDGLAKNNGTVNQRLFLLSLQNAFKVKLSKCES